MLREYDDITRRLGVPLWWDDQGVPRYDRFAPHLCGVYDDYIALCRVRCQTCGQAFTVANSKRRIASSDIPMDSSLSWEYGDPPIHVAPDIAYPGSGKCPGTTMSSILVQILQFWEHGEDGWVRNRSHEMVVYQ